MDILSRYIRHNGILLCNENPELPSFTGMGFGWKDIVELIERREVFYCLAYKGRSTYLSPRAYFLMSRVKVRHEPDDAAGRVYRALELIESAEKDMLRKTSLPDMDKKTFDKAFGFLLKNLYVTAISNGRWLTPNFSSFVYCTAGHWERAAGLNIRQMDDPELELRTLLGNTMNDKNLNALIGRKN